MSSSPTYLDPIVIPLIAGKSVLDVACGYGRWANLIVSNFWEAGLAAPPAIDGFDAFEPNVAFCAAGGSYRHVWHQKLPSALEGRWDTVLACECIEHLPQDHVECVVETLEGVTAKRIIVSTPNQPYYRGGGDTIVGFNAYEAHLSYVPRTFFEDRGYRVIPAGFRKRHRLLQSVVREYLSQDATPSESALQELVRVSPTYVAYKDMEAR